MDLLDDFVFGNLFVRAGLYELVKAHTIRMISDDLHISDYSMISDDCQGDYEWFGRAVTPCWAHQGDINAVEIRVASVGRRQPVERIQCLSGRWGSRRRQSGR